MFGRIAKEVVRVCYEMARGADSIAPIVLKSRLDERDFLHARDVAEAMVIVMEKGENTDYVVGSGKPLTIEEIVVLFITKIMEIVNPEMNPYAVRDLVKYEKEYSDGMKPKASTRKIKRLGWKPKVPIESIIEEMIWSVEHL